MPGTVYRSRTARPRYLRGFGTGALVVVFLAAAAVLLVGAWFS